MDLVDANERQPLLQPSRPIKLSSGRRNAILGLCIGCAFLGTVDLTLVATCLSPIASELGQSEAASWIATGYLWSTTTFTPLYGRLTDHLTRKGAILQALGLFTLGTALCGMATDVKTLAMARFIAGMGGGGVGACTQVLIGDTYSIQERPFYQGLYQLGFAVGIGSGGIIGGAIQSALGWRYAFWLQLPLMVLLIVVAYFAIPPMHRQEQTSWRQVDFGGSLAMLLSVGCLLGTLSLTIEQDRPFSYPPAVMTSIGFVLFLFVFVLVELFVAVSPIMPLFLLRNRSVTCVAIICGLIAVVNFSFIYFLPMFFELVMDKSAAQSGAHLAPNAVAMMIGSPLVGFIISKTHRYKWITTFCALGPLAAMLLISTFTESTPDGLLWFAVIPMGLGFSGLLTSSLIAAHANGTQSQIGAITSFVFLFRSLGQVLGVATSSAIYQGTLGVQLAKVFDDEKIIHQLRHTSTSIVGLDPSTKALARSAFKSGLHNVFYFAAASAIIVGVVSLALPNKSLERDAPSTYKRDPEIS